MIKQHQNFFLSVWSLAMVVAIGVLLTLGD